MTNLKSVDPGAEQNLDVMLGTGEVFVMLNHRNGGGSIHVSTEELLAALNAVAIPEGYVARQIWEAAKARAESAEVILRSANERLALANAKLAAVQNAMVEMRCCAVEASDLRATFVWNQAAGMIQAALLTEESE